MWKQPKCPLTDEWIKKMWKIYIMEYYSAIKRNEIMPLAITMAPHSSTLAWKIPRTEEPGGPQSMGSLTVGHDWATSLSLFTLVHWRRKWHPTPVFLPGEHFITSATPGTKSSMLQFLFSQHSIWTFNYIWSSAGWLDPCALFKYWRWNYRAFSIFHNRSSD